MTRSGMSHVVPLATRLLSLLPWFSYFSCVTCRVLSNTNCWALPPEFLIQKV